MRNRVRALRAVIGGGIAVVLTTPIACAQSMDELTVAHRGASTSKLGEGTLPAYKYAVRNRADILDADVRWTKDGPDADSVGTMVILHDATLDRVTNCTGNVSSWLWSAIRDRCRTEVGGQPLMRVVDLVTYANSVGKSVALEIKVSSISDAQAKQLWGAIKNSRIQLQASSSRLDALNKIKKLDAADTTHKISYALIIVGTRSWPSVSTIKKIAPAVHAKLTIPADVARSYRLANIKVFLYTGKNASDDAKMIARQPYGVVVDDVAQFQHWRDAATGSA
ncbi:MAG TPA: glycerophosphodiester phosphodiesterase family protein [Propionibacteriaceae bacterium]